MWALSHTVMSLMLITLNVHTECIYSSLDQCTGQTFENTEASQAISLLKRLVLTGIGLNSDGMGAYGTSVINSSPVFNLRMHILMEEARTKMKE